MPRSDASRRWRRRRLACRLGAHGAFAAATTPCCAGGSATRYVLRLRRRSLRLRCAPSSWALPKHQSEPPQRRALQHERGAKRSASKLRATSPPVSCGITSGDGGRERAECLQTAGFTHTLRAWPPLPPAAQGIVPHDTTGDSCARRSDFAALRRRRAHPSTKASRRSGECSITCAERSEARAGCMRRRHLCRVASPLVMAAANARNALRLQAGCTPCVRDRHYPCSAGG